MLPYHRAVNSGAHRDELDSTSEQPTKKVYGKQKEKLQQKSTYNWCWLGYEADDGDAVYR